MDLESSINLGDEAVVVVVADWPHEHFFVPLGKLLNFVFELFHLNYYNK
jgi:hypothetical protein